MVAAQLSREEAQQNLWTGSHRNQSSSFLTTTFKLEKFVRKIFVSVFYLPFHTFCLQAMVIINGFLYVFGGTTGYIYSTDLHRLDLTTREWIHLKPNNPPDDLPEERYDDRGV